ncbi:(2Fe-2S)-binding protein [Pseudenhygromyxa sp. WMMC2535]|uniref:(2Fe-2S)-binding protein n=1 Tax=Pseudenhygromyxa sp. WMMC2535 TaxID=2712867 RepID=UPI0015559491|nr:(2Fe-2S)-binding protein [Pseudenhygromyxa sp. WMMC2535]NVB42481.1 (2Fe-2S)-binding protein [Pseudenhygromyxa sp. WMMC2535]
MSDRVFLCRCEDVALSDLDHALAAGLSTIEEIKRYTGLGTGPCQGKECVSALACALVRRGIVAPERLRPFTARPPVEQVSFGALATVPDPFIDPSPPEHATGEPGGEPSGEEAREP